MDVRTINGGNAFTVLSAMQKHIRRGEEREAMHCACELGMTSKPFFSMLCNRLEVISHEDIGLANPLGVMFAATAIEQARRAYDAQKPGKWRLMIGNALRSLCRGDKSREGDHFQAAVGLRVQLHGEAPTIPDYAYDMHTTQGRKKGRGLEHFRTEAARLGPGRTPEDDYADEAYGLWAEKHERAAADKRELF